MELASLIEDLGKACGLELTLDEGRCTLRFDGEHDVTIERDGNAVILHGIAGDGGCLSNPDNLRILLTASFLGAETDGGALSVWERTGEIVLWKRFDAFTDYPDFEAAINAFLAQLIHWKARIDALPSVAVSALAVLALPIAVRAAVPRPRCRPLVPPPARRDRRSGRGAAAFGSEPFCPCGTARAGCPESAGCTRP